MGQKHIVVLFLIIALIGLGAAGISSLKEVNLEDITPTPTPANLIFNAGQDGAGSLRNINMNTNSNKVDQNNQQANSLSPAMVAPTTAKIKQYKQFPGILVFDELKNRKAVIETEKGKIEFEIFTDAPKAASNFIFLVRDGFYDGLTFHRVVPGFVIQGGDPLGNGTGGPGYRFEDEPVTKKYDKGIVAMANAGPNTNGSQFFIMIEDNPQLPPNYTIFGKVITGQDVVGKIAVGDVIRKVAITSVN